MRGEAYLVLGDREPTGSSARYTVSPSAFFTETRGRSSASLDSTMTRDDMRRIACNAAVDGEKNAA